MDETEAGTHIKLTPLWLVVAWSAVLSFGAVVARLVWETTVLSWRSGPQMVGFTMFHQFALPVLLATALFGVTVIRLAVAVVLALVRRQRLSLSIWLLVCTSAAYAGLLLVPEVRWQHLFIDRFAQSPGRDEFACGAAARGDVALLQGFAQRGVQLDALQLSFRFTVLHCAAWGGQPEAIDFILGRFPELLNKPDADGNSPLDTAVAENRQEAAQELARHGAKRGSGKSGAR
jgi:hypothetical protein